MRSVAPWLLLSSAILVSFAACGPGDDTGDAGIIGDCEEACDGDTLVTCDGDDAVETNCATDFDSCLEVGGEFDCAAAVGSSCLVDGVLSFCEGTESGCVLDADNEDVCVENVGSCVAADERTCDGDELVAECKSGQPYLIDCAAFGATCAADDGCISPAEGFCDDVDFFCDDGLTCTDFVCG